MQRALLRNTNTPRQQKKINRRRFGESRPRGGAGQRDGETRVGESRASKEWVKLEKAIQAMTGYGKQTAVSFVYHSPDPAVEK
jgi:hypothetical protein